MNDGVIMGMTHHCKVYIIYFIFICEFGFIIKSCHDGANLYSIFIFFRIVKMGRLLHYVYKIPHRGDSVKFYRDLGMKSLRHEEFTEGCEAQVRRP